MSKVSKSRHEYLKQVSRIKHLIHSKYFAPWQIILGSAHARLAYVDCFAGDSTFKDEDNNYLPGSPVRALRLSASYVEAHPNRSLILRFVEKDRATAERLKTVLAAEEPVPNGVQYSVEQGDAQDFAESLVSTVKSWGVKRLLVPTFFFIDPYGHPITLPVIRDLLGLGQTEVFLNLMWYQISRDLGNTQATAKFDLLFGHSDWRQQRFMYLHGLEREKAFEDYVAAQVGASYCLPFRVHFSPEDKIKGGEKRTKFCLMHFSNHKRAALLMKDVMSGAGEVMHEMRASYNGQELQPHLFSVEPGLQQLQAGLLARYHKTRRAFEDIRAETLDWPFSCSQYRQALISLEAGSVVTIDRKVSKKTGLKDRDVVVFP